MYAGLCLLLYGFQRLESTTLVLDSLQIGSAMLTRSMLHLGSPILVYGFTTLEFTSLILDLVGSDFLFIIAKIFSFGEFLVDLWNGMLWILLAGLRLCEPGIDHVTARFFSI